MREEFDNNLRIDELKSMVEDLNLIAEFDNIKTEYCTNCCFVLGGGLAQ